MFAAEPGKSSFTPGACNSQPTLSLPSPPITHSVYSRRVRAPAPLGDGSQARAARSRLDQRPGTLNGSQKFWAEEAGRGGAPGPPPLRNLRWPGLSSQPRAGGGPPWSMRGRGQYPISEGTPHRSAVLGPKKNKMRAAKEGSSWRAGLCPTPLPRPAPSPAPRHLSTQGCSLLPGTSPASPQGPSSSTEERKAASSGPTWVNLKSEARAHVQSHRFPQNQPFFPP